MQPSSILRIAFANVLVFIGLVMFLLLFVSVAGDSYNLAKSFFPKKDKRAELPSYADHEKAQRIYRDQRGSIKNYAPFVEWRHIAEHSENLNIDDNGRRIHAIGLDNLPDATTLGFFGGSTVWGTGVDDDGTLPAQFDSITSEYIITNYGERGYTSFQNVIDLMTLMSINVAPKNVVFLEGFNDVWTHCNQAVTSLINSHMEEKRIQGALDRSGKENYTLNNIVKPIISLVSEVVADSDETIVPSCSNNPERAEQVAEMIVRNLEISHALVQSYGGRFFAFLQPNAFVGTPRLDHMDFTGSARSIQRKQFEAVYPLVRSKMLARGAGWFFDLSNVLDGHQYLLVDHTHVTAEGNKLIAESVKKYISGF